MSDTDTMADDNYLDALRKDSQEKLEQLAREGVGLDRMMMLKVRLDVLTDIVVGDDEGKAWELESRYEEVVNKMITSAVEEVSRLRLQADVEKGIRLLQGGAGPQGGAG